MKKIFVIVVTYNGIIWIEKCLSSLINSSIPVNIIIVDNGSTDGTQEVIRQKFSDLEFIQSEENLGFGAGNNIGIKLAMEKGAECFFLLNQDAWVESDTIEKLVKAAGNNKDFGVISPIHFNGSGELLDKHFLNHVLSDNRKISSDLFRNKSEEIYEVNFVNAAAWLISLSCINRVGFFDPLFFHYGEDENFAYRCKYFGYKIGVVRDSFIYHDREDVIKKKELQNNFDFNYIKLSWFVKMTDINDTDWSKNYNKDLVVFLLKIASRTTSDRRKFLNAYFRLKGLKNKIEQARERMSEGSKAY